MKTLELSDTLRIPVEEAIRSSHRRMIVVSSGDEELQESLISNILDCYSSNKGRVSLLAVYDEPVKDLAEAVLKTAKNSYDITAIAPQDSEKILGGTWDVLLGFSPQEYTPNTLGRLIETIRGGGIIVLSGPPLAEWYAKPAGYHEKLVSPPYSLEDVNRLYTKRLVRKLKEYKGIWIVEDGSVYGTPLESPPPGRRRPKIPKNVEFPRSIYKMAATEDQLRVIQKIEKLYCERKRKRRYLLIRADRGRGKSASLGIALAGLVYKNVYRDIPVTAPSISNAETMLEYLEKTLQSLGVKTKRRLEEDAPVIEADGVRVRYVTPYALAKKEGEFAVVDEAAGIPLPLLLKIAKNYDNVIYASTVHGYEGSGRGFGIRFVKRLKSLKDAKVSEIEMTEPIRYSPGDPIEKWLYDVLLLDAEPEELEDEYKKRIPDKLSYVKANLEEWFSAREDKLRRFIGTYVTAHYRNRPDDLLLLGEAPHHFARIVEDDKGKILVALHLAEEGGLPRGIIKEIVEEGRQPHGHLIPAVLLKYMPREGAFGKLRGIRIVRIAVHPELMGRGLGSRALEMLENEAAEEKDWVGASFGASYELLRFWMKNGYLPLHISPMRNAASGEYSVIVVKPLTKRAEALVYRMNLEFKKRLLGSLHDSYFGLEAGVAYQLLKCGKPGFLQTVKLTRNQSARMDMYVKGYISYESATDIVRALMEAHLLSSPDTRVSLDEKLEKALVAKAVQGKSWALAAKISGMPLRKLVDEFRSATRLMGEKYAS